VNLIVNNNMLVGTVPFDASQRTMQLALQALSPAITVRTV
jgi:hypothetical protein